MKLTFAAEAALAALGLLVAGDTLADCKLAQLAELPITMHGMRPTIPAKFNGADVRLVVDSGAFFSLLSPAAASEFNLPLKSGHGIEMIGLGGKVRLQVATVKTLSVFNIDIPNVDFIVGGTDLGGEVAGVLGQNLLRVGDVEYDLAHGVIRITREEGCRGAILAYWATGLPLSIIDIGYATALQPHTTGTARLNDTKIVVAFDTGAAVTAVTRAAAERAGIKMNQPGVVAADLMFGFGPKAVRSWIAPVTSFKIGEEEIRNTRIRVVDTDIARFDMLIGADFFLSHRIYVANGQRKLYFTYNGGPVFKLEQATPATASAGAGAGTATTPTSDGAPSAVSGTVSDGASAASTGTPAGEARDATSNAVSTAAAGTAATQNPPPAKPSTDDPTDAAGFSRRGTAFAARHDYGHAISDLTRAIELDPNDPSYPYERGMARWQNAQPALALADFDQALKLKPDDVPALIARAQFRMANKDAEGATADLDTAARVAPAESEDRFEIGMLYIRTEHFSPAADQFDLWIPAHRADVRLPAGMGERCRARAFAGDDLNRALEDCDAALKGQPKFPPLLSARALVQFKLRHFDKAISDWSEVVAKKPGDAWPLYARGVARMRTGMTTQGQADITAATAMSTTVAELSKKRGVVPPE